jgi:hypothetical protein
MDIFCKFFTVLLLFCAAASAAKILAVLEITPKTDDVEMSISEFQHLTDELRTRARESLPESYTILTRDNIIQLLPPDEDERECLAEGCAVEIGRAIGAEYVTQGVVGKFGDDLTLTVELYESMSGNMLSSFVMESDNIKGLLNSIREKAPGLFAKLSEPKKELRIEEKPQPLVPSPQSQKFRTSTWVAIGLDVLGAAVLGFGIYKQVEGSKLYSDYEKEFKVGSDASPRSFEELQDLERRQKAALDKSNDARKMGSVSIIAGGVLLVSGVMVHVWF